jgi:FlaA1/EpsC-like NDP-sugar epimerase
MAAGGGRIRGRHMFLYDLAATAASIYLALAIRADALILPATVAAFTPVILIPLLARPLVNIRFGLYRRVWRYASIDDLIQTAIATLVGSFIALLLVFGLVLLLGVASREPVPPSFWVIEWTFNLAFVGGIRLVFPALSELRVHRSTAQSTQRRIPTLLFGAGDAGTVMARSSLREPKAGVRPVGFLDDNPARAGKSLVGLPIFGDLTNLDRAIAATGAQMLLITMPRVSGPAVRRVVEAGLAAGLEVRTVPPIHELLDGTIDAFQTRRVKVEDLLGRPLATEHAPAVEALIRDKTVMITGAGGSIGSELARQVYGLRPRRIVLVDRAESPLYTIHRELEVRRLRGTGAGQIDHHLANVVSRDRIARIIGDSVPDVIFHAAAYKHVPMMEEHPAEGVQVNVAGTRSVLDAAIDAGVPRFVFVSTDKAVQPSSVMGATKRIAEELVAEAARRTGRAYVSVRFGNVLGAAGSVVPIFLGQLERGETLTVTHPEMTRYFMTIPEAGWLILDAAALGQTGDLFVLDMGQPVRILDLANDLVRLSGRTPDSVIIEFTGLRPGEKLHESLFYEHEVVEPTEVAKVLRAASAPSTVDIRRRVADLLQWATSQHDDDLRRVVFELVEDLAGPSGVGEGESRPSPADNVLAFPRQPESPVGPEPSRLAATQTAAPQ